MFGTPSRASSKEGFTLSEVLGPEGSSMCGHRHGEVVASMVNLERSIKCVSIKLPHVVKYALRVGAPFGQFQT